MEDNKLHIEEKNILHAVCVKFNKKFTIDHLDLHNEHKFNIQYKDLKNESIICNVASIILPYFTIDDIIKIIEYGYEMNEEFKHFINKIVDFYNNVKCDRAGKAILETRMSDISKNNSLALHIPADKGPNDITIKIKDDIPFKAHLHLKEWQDKISDDIVNARRPTNFGKDFDEDTIASEINKGLEPVKLSFKV